MLLENAEKYKIHHIKSEELEAKINKAISKDYTLICMYQDLCYTDYHYVVFRLKNSCEKSNKNTPVSVYGPVVYI